MKSDNHTIKFLRNERGAALVTVVMISVLLLIACIAMLSSVSSHTANVTDVTSETKAYYAAESGIQATIHVLRGNTTPIEPFTASAELGVASQRITYKRATNPLESNLSSDTSTYSRLSRWIVYNYTPSGRTLPDRVVIGESPSTYTPQNGVAYSVQVNDPDRTRERLKFSTSFTSTTAGADGKTLTFTGATPNDKTTISFETVAGTSVDFTQSAVPNPKMFVMKVAKIGLGGNSAAAQYFEIKYEITEPRNVIRIMRGTVTLINSSSQVQVKLSSYAYTIAGSDMHLCLNSACTSKPTSAGFVMTVPAAGSEVTDTIYGKITPLEPYRLQLISTGYGPNGAKKKLETMIQKNFFNDLTAPAAVVLIGPPGPGFLWEPGQSKNVSYCGVPDSDPDLPCTFDPNTNPYAVPPIGVTNQTNLNAVISNAPKSGYTPAPAEIGAEMPDWLDSPTSLDAVVGNLRDSSKTAQTYYSGTNPPTFGIYDASMDLWNGVTFCEGNCSLTGIGGGILVVTGTLTLPANFSFKGMILVTGAGGVVRNGAGNIEILGNLIIAPYNPASLSAGFLSPKYDMRGGGIGDFIYSGSSANFNGQTAISDFVQGVSEK